MKLLRLFTGPAGAAVLTASALNIATVAAPASAPAAAAPASGAAVAEATSGSGVAAPPTVKNYVALGDSYTSAPLVPPLDLTTLGCMRSKGNYPALLAPKVKAPKMTDVSCVGADTTHLNTGQANATGFVPPQFNALTKETDLVTLGIGANDFGVFADLFGVCPSLQKSDPDGAPCKKQFSAGGKDHLKENVAKTRTRVVQALKEIKKRVAPKAHVVVVGYPRIAPPKGQCPELPIAKGDYAYVNSIEVSLNTALLEAAKEGGAKYVEVFKPSEGHDVCAKDKAWVQGKDPDLLKAASYHPRAEEQAAVADLIVKALSGQAQSVSSVDRAALEERRQESARLLQVPANRDRVKSRLAQGALFPAR